MKRRMDGSLRILLGVATLARFIPGVLLPGASAGGTS